ncbi:MAG: ribosome silencing factor [Clostridia bacterium]|nr:ribosome silencing factor [Clostridia bacterium]
MTEPITLVKTIAAVLDKKKAEDIVAIKTEEVTIVSDYFVLASGASSTHTRALADDVEYEIKERLDLAPEHIEGRATGWILLDYGTVIVHVFDRESREYYNLERLWADAQQIDLSDVISPD